MTDQGAIPIKPAMESNGLSNRIVVPANAGTQGRRHAITLDPRFRGVTGLMFQSVGITALRGAGRRSGGAQPPPIFGISTTSLSGLSGAM
jgi:hypothetical protein